MMRAVKLLFASFFCLLNQLVTAQIAAGWPVQSEMYFVANPAMASQLTTETIGLVHGRRWNRIKSSPSLSNIFGILPLENEKMVVAFQAFSDKIGPLAGNGLDLAYSYHTRSSRRSSDQLSLGVSLRLVQFRFDQGHLISNELDPLIGLIPSKGMVPPSINIGVSYQTEEVDHHRPVQMIFALSARRQLFSRTRFNPSQLEQLSCHGMAGLKILSNPEVHLEPTLLVNNSASDQVDYALRLKSSHVDYGWITIQYSKVGVVLGELGFLIGKGDSGVLRLSAGNSWFLGNVSTQLGHSVFFGLSYQF